MIDYPHKLTDEVYEYIKGEATHVLVQDHIRLRPILGQEIAMKEHIKLIPYSTLSGKKLEAIKALSKYSVWDPENEDTLEEFWGWEDTQKYIEDNHLVITI